MALAPAADTRPIPIVELEFVNAPIADIVVAIASAAGVAIVVDDTVSGYASYYFDPMPFDVALEAFARRFGLFVSRDNGVYTVTAALISFVDDALTIDAPSVDSAALVRAISRASRTPIVHAFAAGMPVSLFTDGASVEEALRRIAAQLPDAEIAFRDGVYRIAPVRPAPDHAWRTPPVTVDAAGFSVNTERASFVDLLTALFVAGEREYHLLKRSNPMIGPVRVNRRSFDDALRLIVERADASFTVVDGVYYIADATPHAALARSIVTEVIVLRSIAPAVLLDLLPPDQTTDVTIRADRTDDRLTITGNPMSVARIGDLVDLLDVPPAGRGYHRFDLETIDPTQLHALLPRHLAGLPITAVSSSRIVVLTTAERADELRRFLSAIDLPIASTLIELEYIRLDQLIANLHSATDRMAIVPTGDPSRFFFRGDDAELLRFRTRLKHIDRPLPQIRYQLLVIEYKQGRTLDWDASLSNALKTPDSTQAFLAVLGNLLSLSFDIVSTFGYQFAVRLNSSLSDASATVLADTTISGTSGRQVSFQNTSTYRYRDPVIDPETGVTRPTGVVREITSGLTLQIEGWAGASDSVTMDVVATVSRRGSEGVAKGNPPPTSEKVVRTHIRTTAGTPVILSGLIQSETDSSSRETPLLGRIPVLGWLFRGMVRSRESTELAVYIVPYVDRDRTDRLGVEQQMLDVLDSFNRSATADTR
ncbi:MAG: hypothetical protein EA382_02315 [Spirochaetaceae bacterium]|nr:MAG: hypothetical protein EA382_02315 [Spirochaetaceae bacterium]